MNEDIEAVSDGVSSTTTDWINWLKEVDDTALKVGSHYLWYDEDFDDDRYKNFVVGRSQTLPTAHSDGPYVRSLVTNYDVEEMTVEEVKCNVDEQSH